MEQATAGRSTPVDSLAQGAPSPALTQAGGPVYYGSIDALKAGAILTVVYIHAFSDFKDLEVLNLRTMLTGFAVPAFFFASGLLHFRSTPVPFALVRRWAMRILPPYVVVSLLAFVFRRFVLDDSLTAGQMFFALVTCSAWPIYYFVAVLLGALLAGALLARFPALVGPVFAAFWCFGAVALLGFEPMGLLFGWFWFLRSPFLWWGYFFAGWFIGKHWEVVLGISPTMRARVFLLASLSVTGVVAITLSHPLYRGRFVGLLVYVANYSLLTAIFLLSHGRRPSQVQRFLSDATYPLYLWHYFFTTFVREGLHIPGVHSKALGFFAGVAGSLAVVLVGRRIFGRHAKLVIG